MRQLVEKVGALALLAGLGLIVLSFLGILINMVLTSESLIIQVLYAGLTLGLLGVIMIMVSDMI